jgi:glucans biosynthesis protein
VVENNLRYNPETKGWRLTLRLKVKDPSKSTEMRAALVRDPVEPAKPAKGNQAARPRPSTKAKGQSQGRATCRRRGTTTGPGHHRESADRDLELSVACR